MPMVMKGNLQANLLLMICVIDILLTVDLLIAAGASVKSPGSIFFRVLYSGKGYQAAPADGYSLKIIRLVYPGHAAVGQASAAGQLFIIMALFQVLRISLAGKR